MKNPFFLIYTFGLGGKHVTTSIPFERKLAVTILPEGLTIGNLSLPPSIVEQAVIDDIGNGEEKNMTDRDGRRKEEKQWTWPKMDWREGRAERKNGNWIFNKRQTPAILVKEPLWVEGESRILVEASVSPPTPIITQWTLKFTQVFFYIWRFISNLRIL